MKKNSTPFTNKVVAYIRKSSEDKEDGGANKQVNSLEYQKNFIRETIKKEGLELAHPPFEDDKTGYEAYVRPGFDKMLEYLRENRGEIDGIVCTEISRIARNFGDGGEILWFLQSGIIKKIIIHGKTFTDSSSDQLMVAIEFAISKKSSDDTGYRTLQGMRNKVHSLKHPSMAPILGYKSEGIVGAKKWIIDKDIAPKVKAVFEMFSTGKLDLQEVADYAFSIGLRSSDSKSKSTHISKNTWRNRLSDLKYTGVFEHEGEKIVGNYEHIIESELFYIVQDVLLGNKHAKNIHMDYAYTGLIQCGLCGGLLSATHKKGNTYYRCGKRNLPCKKLEKVPYINEKDLEKELLTAFEQIEIDDELWKQAREYVDEINQPQKAELTRDLRKIEGQIIYEDKMQLNFGQKFSSGLIDKPSYDKLLEDSRAKQVSLRKTIISLENLKHELDSLMFGLLDNIKHVTSRLKVASPDNRRAMVEIFCENLSWDNEKVRWDWKKPYYFLTKQNKNSSMLPR